MIEANTENVEVDEGGERSGAPGVPAAPRVPGGRRKKYVPVVGPRLKVLLGVVFALFALLGVNSVYMSSITYLGWKSGETYENYFYLWMMIGHLGLGLLITLPVIVFGFSHLRKARNRPNRRAIRAGYALFVTALVLLGTGFVLMRVGDTLVLKDQAVRGVVYWLHVITPLVAVWLFVLHRLAGRRIKWKIGLTWAGVAGVFAVVMMTLHAQDPRQWNVAGNAKGDKYFFPSLSRTVSGDFIPERVLDNTAYCLECHGDIYDTWEHSVHRFSSFNNPAYFFSVRNTRKALYARDGEVQGSRFCAGCHDPVPFFSGAFDDPKYDDPGYDLAADPAGRAGITCTACHAISHVNSPRGNADYTIDEPVHYPFAFSEHAVLKWVNRQLVKAKPAFHKKTFLKPLHTTAEFCGTCHKVHLPVELNNYKWLRGQNHYDAFFLSGVSGQGITSFYYPPKAEVNCNGCHMPLMVSDDFGAKANDDSGALTVHDHQWPSANTAMPTMVEMPDSAGAIEKHRAFLKGAMRVDIFGVREGGTITGQLTAPIRPEIPVLRAGAEYLLETVIRTVKMGHVFTQGTADSNEVWMEVRVTDDRGVIGGSGGRRAEDHAVDPWAHFVNAFVIDRAGNRINRRNAEDIFTALYSHQIPPGAADSVHYLLRVPEDVQGAITVTVKLQYRKFDTEYMRFVTGDGEYVNDLPITTLAEDSVVFAVEGGNSEARPSAPLQVVAPARATGSESPWGEWQRWNDYGIGLLRKGQRGELRQAEEAFRRVEALGWPDGPLNLARVYLKEGRVGTDAPEALERARNFVPPANEWSLLWFAGLVDKQNGRLDEAIVKFEQIVAGGFSQAAGRGFDFSKDYRLLNMLGETIFERAKQERGKARRADRVVLLEQAEGYFLRALEFDPENATAHYSLKQIYTDLGEEVKAEEHGRLHLKYKVDDNARDSAIAAARRKYPAANRAAEAVVIYDLMREGFTTEYTESTESPGIRGNEN